MPKTDRNFPSPHRLQPAAYAESDTLFHITIRAYAGTSPFRVDFGSDLWRNIEEQRAMRRVAIWAACLMPDHLHLVVSSRTEPVDRWVASFKSFTTTMSRRYGISGRLWQPSYYDRAIRQGELDSVVQYLRRNPVVTGLVVEPEDWSWVGVWVEAAQ